MVAYIRSDLDFILAQIKIAEAHAAGTPLYGTGGLIPSYNLAWGLRTVDGTYNNLLHPTWGSADQPFPEGLGTNFRPVAGTPLDFDGPGPAPAMPTAPNYNPSNNPGSFVVDPALRTISNLIVDQTLGNPSAILTALQRAGTVTPANQMSVTAEISAAYAPLKPLFDALGSAEREFANASAAAAASPGNPALQAAAAAAQQDVVDAQAAVDLADDALMTLLDTYGVVLDGSNVSIPNLAPDEGLSAPFNSWFTLFGQFFDHGLDLVNKGGSGTVFIPLLPDDPLYDPTSPTNFMVLTRATVGPGVDGVMGTADDTRPVNTTTSFVDQNQTYTSHASHQVFLRQYALNAANDPVATGKLIEGGNGGMATWADVKAQAADLLGIQLIDSDVGNVPLLATDQYGEFIRGPNGYPQMVFPGATPGTFTLVEGDPAANGGLGVLTAGAVRTGHAFLADIAHSAVPTGLADGDIEIGLGNPDNGPTNGQYDNELLDAHYIAGDGRANENIGLTAVHHVFHSEHNRLVEHTKEVVLADAAAMLDAGASHAEAVAFLNEWLTVDVATVPATMEGLSWDGERLFQAAKFGTEMQYQHLVFEEFARKIQPNINVFLVPDGYDVTINPDIVAEFAHVVYRFGHSMLNETIDRFDPTFTDHDIGLIEGFLNPLQFETNGTSAVVDADISAGAIIRGMTRQVGNQIDEFVTSALRNNLLGLPLDLATINLARGRDTGVPSLNATRREFYEATNEESLLKPYESWVDFAGHLKNEASIINFVAAYGTHELITNQTTVEGKRDAALTIITGLSVGGLEVPADATDFLNATGAYAGGTLGGLENVDLWIGGLAEEIMPFGGMLGSTFNFVFETQMERLQNGDRFYYLQRLDGLHLFSEMEGNSFAAMIMRNTNATHLPSDVFSTPGLILEVDRTKQYNEGLGETAGADGILLDNPATAANEAADNIANDPTGGGILTPLVIRNDPATAGPDTNYLRYTGDEHVVLGGTEASDILIASIGDDTLFGDGGNDRLEGNFGNDIINGGAGDDIIRDAGGDDNIKAGDGNDVVNAGPGLDLVLAGAGQDFVVLGTDMGSEVFGGEGNDFILGNKNAERILGNEGDDWLETGTFDGAPGDNFDEIFAKDGIRGNDVFLGDGGFDEFIGEGGDDIFVGSPGRGKMAGMSGFDWATYKDNAQGVNADLSIPIVFDEAPTLPQNAALDEFESVQGLSGTRFNDTLSGSNEDATTLLPLSQGGSTGFLGSGLDAQGIDLIKGLQDVLGEGLTSFAAGDIILGGDGSDVIRGNAGDDIIDGDKWLDVQIGVFAANDPDHTGTPLALHKSMTTLASSMFNGSINPGQLAIVRTIRDSADQPDSDGLADTDVAVFSDLRANYTLTANPDGTISVAHVTVSDGLVSDGVDRVRNVEVLRFSDGDVSLIKPVVDLHAFDVGGTYADTFATGAYNLSTGSTTWGTVWTEAGDDGSPTNAVGQIQINGGSLRFDTGDGATISRTVPLAGAASARLTYSVVESGLDDDTIQVEFSSDGTTWVNVGTIDNATNTTTRNVDLPGPFTATSAIRFVASSFENASGFLNPADIVDIGNVAIEFTLPAPADGLNYTTSYTENAVGTTIANRPSITDDGTTLVSARIVLTNAQLGDDLDIGALPAGISGVVDTSVAGVITVNLTGTASHAAYRAAIQAVTFDSTSDNPSTVARVLQTTVNDGFAVSDPVTTTINVTAVNDAPVGNPDTVITNVLSGVNFSIARSALLANDSDPEGSGVSITAVGGQNGLNAPVLGPTAVTVSDTGLAGGSFNYVASDGALTDPTTTVSVTRVTGTINGGAGSEIIVGDGTGGNIATGIGNINGGGGNDYIDAGDGNDVVSGGTGNDNVLAGTGNDTIIWNGNAGDTADGFDIVDGGAGATDTFVLNGGSAAETFRIYAKEAAIAAGVPVSGATTEIVITRTVGLATTVIAELDNIEEIRVNTQQVTSPTGTPPGGNSTNSGDTIQVIGNFNAPFTSLNFNTITIDGNAGDDTVDISSLQSAHRIVFRSNGGNDTIVGTLRDQDVIELAPGLTVADYSKTVNENGTVTLKSDTHSVTYMSDGEPVVEESEEDEEDNEDPVVAGERFTVRKGEAITLTAAQLLANDLDPDGGTLSILEIDEDEHGKAVLNGDGTITFTPKAGFTGEASFSYTVADGQGGTTEGTVTILVEKPAPMAVNGGRGHDRLFGDDANDRLKGQDGHDRLDGGDGADKMWGGRGNDLYIVDDRGDRVYEGRSQGVDTVKAEVSYSLSGTHVEKLVLTGSGNLDGTGNGLDNSITGNAGNNVLKGGAGEDGLKGMGGNDKLHGGSDDDRLEGGSGNDELHGGSGRDKLHGGSGDDRLDGGSGNDKLHGDSGQDIFVFEKGSGWDTVADFRSGQDRVDVSGLSGVKGTSDLNLTQMGEDAVIWHGSDILVLKGVQASDLDSSDFVF